MDVRVEEADAAIKRLPVKVGAKLQVHGLMPTLERLKSERQLRQHIRGTAFEVQTHEFIII